MRRALASIFLALLTLPAEAALRAAVFPFDFLIPTKEEDFFIGPRKPSVDEQRRLELVRAEMGRLVTAGGRYEMLDISGLVPEIEAAAPLSECNGCEVDLARKSGADIVFLGTIEKVSDTVLNLQLLELEVGSGAVKRRMSAVIQGNTDDAWLGGVRWLVKNRVLAREEPRP